MNAGSTNLTNFFVSHSDGNGDESSGDDCDSSVPKDDGESLVEEEPAARKRKGLNDIEKNCDSLISKLTMIMQRTEHECPAIDGELASIVDKIMREKANEKEAVL